MTVADYFDDSETESIEASSENSTLNKRDEIRMNYRLDKKKSIRNIVVYTEKTLINIEEIYIKNGTPTCVIIMFNLAAHEVSKEYLDSLDANMKLGRNIYVKSITKYKDNHNRHITDKIDISFFIE